METFAIPGVGGILELTIGSVRYILLQERCKPDAPDDYGLLEIPTGKVRAFEDVFSCLRREVKEETGLEVVEIYGEDRSTIRDYDRYQVLNYTPFASVQNLKGAYPIIAQIFICTVRGTLKTRTDESRNVRWIPLPDLLRKLTREENRFYPMHITTLKKYLALYVPKQVEWIGTKAGESSQAPLGWIAQKEGSGGEFFHFFSDPERNLVPRHL